jgi:hypothetical protein
LGATPLDSIPLPRFASAGAYKLRIELAGYAPAEVLTDLFADWTLGAGGGNALDTLYLDRLGEFPGMVRIRGGRFTDVRGDSLTIADYHLGKYEVTNQEFARFVAAGGYKKREYWTEPMVRDGRELSWDQAMAEFRDRTGQPGPSTWSAGTFPAGQADFPVGGVSYYEALAFARFAGKSLPTSLHWRIAALRHFREAGWLFLRSSNLAGTAPRAVGKGLFNPFGLYDVAGNVREWCLNPIDSGRLVTGASWEDDEFRTTHRLPQPALDRSPTNGFRLASYTDDSATIARLSGRIVRREPRDYRKAVAVADAEFAIYRRMYDYDRRPLDARRDTAGIQESYAWEKVSFSAAYGGERMAAYVFIPKTGRPPYEAVIFWPPGSPSVRATDPFVPNLVGFIPLSGRVLVYPVFKGADERDGKQFSAAGFGIDSSARYRDLAVQWVKDFRRTIDYLETRTDIKLDRIGFYGVSWGGEMAPLPLAIEPRVKAAVLNSGGYASSSPRPEVEPVNFAPRVHTPTLLLNGRHDDVLFPYVTSQVPFFQQLGTAATDKRQVLFPESHIVVSDSIVHLTLGWFDRYLSGVGKP